MTRDRYIVLRSSTIPPADRAAMHAADDDSPDVGVAEHDTVRGGSPQSSTKANHTPERLEAIGTRVLEIAHDIKNPIGFIMMSADYLSKSMDDLGELLDTYAELEHQFGERERELLAEFKAAIGLKELRSSTTTTLQAINDGALRIRAMVESMLAFASTNNVRTFQLADLSQCLVRTMGPIAREYEQRIEFGEAVQRIEFNVEADPVPRIECLPERIQQMMANLIVNAAQALPQGGHVWVGLRPSPDGTRVVLSVRDDGVGIPEEVRDRVLEPFFTTRPAGEGSGLGLAIVNAIVGEHQGEITIQSETGKGTLVAVSLPVTRKDGGLGRG